MNFSITCTSNILYHPTIVLSDTSHSQINCAGGSQTLVFPGCHALFLKLIKHIISWMTFLPFNRISSGRYNKPYVMFIRNLIGFASIVDSISINLINTAFNLVNNSLKNFTLAPTSSGYFYTDNILLAPSEL